MGTIDERIAAAIKIALNPQNYKICEGCDSIVVASTRICPNCHSYRYNYNVEDVIDQADNLSNQEQKTVTKEDMF